MPTTPNETFVNAALDALPRCDKCGLPVAFIGHHGDIPTHLAPDYDPDRTVEATSANRDHDPAPVWT